MAGFLSMTYSLVQLAEDDYTLGLDRAMARGLAWGGGLGFLATSLVLPLVWREGWPELLFACALSTLVGTAAGVSTAGRSRQREWRLLAHNLGGLSSGGVKRVYKTLVRFVYCDGRVDDAELEVLEELKSIWGLTPRAADRLEREGRDQTRFKLRRDRTERDVLLHAVRLLVSRKGGTLTSKETSYLRRLLKAFGVRNLEGWLARDQ